jgi:hypothetical protein
MTFTIPITLDTILEGEEDLIIALNPIDKNAGDNLGSRRVATLTIADKPGGGGEHGECIVEFVEDNYYTSEAVGIATIPIKMSGSGIGCPETRVIFSTFEAMAQAGEDYTDVYIEKTFRGGPSEVLLFTFPITNRVGLQGSRTVNMSLRAIPKEAPPQVNSNGDTAQRPPPSVRTGRRRYSRLFIADSNTDDETTSVVEFADIVHYASKNPYDETGRSDIMLRRTGNLNESLDVDYGIYSATAQVGVDLGDTSASSVSFSAGEATTAIPIEILDSEDAIDDETAVVIIHGTKNEKAKIGPNNQIVVNLTSDDAAENPGKITLEAEPEGRVLPNGVDVFEMTVTVLDGHGEPLGGQEVTLTIPDYITVRKDMEQLSSPYNITTDDRGKITFTVALSSSQEPTKSSKRVLDELNAGRPYTVSLTAKTGIMNSTQKVCFEKAHCYIPLVLVAETYPVQFSVLPDLPWNLRTSSKILMNSGYIYFPFVYVNHPRSSYQQPPIPTQYDDRSRDRINFVVQSRAADGLPPKRKIDLRICSTMGNFGNNRNGTVVTIEKGQGKTDSIWWDADPPENRFEDPYIGSCPPIPENPPLCGTGGITVTSVTTRTEGKLFFPVAIACNLDEEGEDPYGNLLTAHLTVTSEPLPQENGFNRTLIRALVTDWHGTGVPDENVTFETDLGGLSEPPSSILLYFWGMVSNNFPQSVQQTMTIGTGWEGTAEVILSHESIGTAGVKVTADIMEENADVQAGVVGSIEMDRETEVLAARGETSVIKARPLSPGGNPLPDQRVTFDLSSIGEIEEIYPEEGKLGNEDWIRVTIEPDDEYRIGKAEVTARASAATATTNINFVAFGHEQETRTSGYNSDIDEKYAEPLQNFDATYEGDLDNEAPIPPSTDVFQDTPSDYYKFTLHEDTDVAVILRGIPDDGIYDLVLFDNNRVEITKNTTDVRPEKRLPSPVSDTSKYLRLGGNRKYYLQIQGHALGSRNPYNFVVLTKPVRSQ